MPTDASYFHVLFVCRSGRMGAGLAPPDEQPDEETGSTAHVGAVEQPEPEPEFGGRPVSARDPEIQVSCKNWRQTPKYMHCMEVSVW